jgi:N6-adenosine-specific RNA methylase IME4
MGQGGVMLEYHEYANLFPMMNPAELGQLCDDMRATGYDKTAPIVLCDGKILDGRNRQLAADTVGVIPEYSMFVGDDPLAYVIRHNLHRRHLNESQRAMVGARIADMKRGRQALNTSIDVFVSQPKAAEMMNVGVATVQRARQVIDHGTPEIIAKVESGEMAVSRAIQEIKRAEVINHLENIEAKEVKATTGVYDVIVIDPPWDMEKIERDVAPNQVGFEYPTMSDDEIKSLSIPFDDNCHVWLWTTHKKLPYAFELLKAWGLKYVCTFTWHKPGGFQPFGLPQYNCEFALYARRGTPVFNETKNFMVCFTAPRRAHSEKPEEFYEVVRRVTPGRRLDMFNRRSIEGFDTWGNEAK